MIHKPEGRRFYTVKFKTNGKPIQKRTKATSAKDARAIEAIMRSELARGNFGILKPKRAPILGEFLRKDFGPFSETRFMAKPKTRDYYRYGMERLLARVGSCPAAPGSNHVAARDVLRSEFLASEPQHDQLFAANPQARAQPR